jgi:Kelch motif/Galactose oxidase, central domain
VKREFRCGSTKNRFTIRTPLLLGRYFTDNNARVSRKCTVFRKMCPARRQQRIRLQNYGTASTTKTESARQKEKNLMKTACTSRLAFLNPRVLTGFALYAAGLVLAFAPMSSADAEDNADTELSQSAPEQAPGRWKVTGSMVTARDQHTATLLRNRQVLVAGGFNGTAVLASAELYDPATGMWTATGSMTSGRELHTATLLPNGQVLVAGGIGDGVVYLASAELYDPATGVWTATGNMATARFADTATLLPNGQVLVAAGSNLTGPLARAELYDPATGMWTATGSMATAREVHTATLLLNGQVLVAGGSNNRNYLESAELYDPATGVWTATQDFVPGRYSHTATLLPHGQVLVSGGSAQIGVLTRAQLYRSAPEALDIE